TGGDVPLRKAEYGVLSLPTMIGEDPYAYSIRGGEISASDGGIAGQNVPENKPPPVSGRAN
ncbi:MULTISPECIES: hypothetical protein, partial [Enterobacteriaceae]